MGMHSKAPGSAESADAIAAGSTPAAIATAMAAVTLTTIPNPTTLDSFGNTKIAELRTVGDYAMVSDALPETIFTHNSGSNTSGTYDSNSASYELALGDGGTTADTGHKLRRTRHHHYLAGHSQEIAITWVGGTAHASVRRDVGYFDNNNGVMLKEKNGALTLLIRDSTSGSVVETNAIAQASWSEDTFDGSSDANNPSGKTLDSTVRNIMVIDLQWLAVGTVRVGFDWGGSDGVIWAHYFVHQGVSGVLPYMATATLPVSWQISAEGGEVTTKHTMTQICAAVGQRGGTAAEGVPKSAGNGSTTISVTTRRPICSVRAQSNLVPIIINHIETFSEDKAAHWELVRNGALTNASFANVTNSSIALDVAATGITGGFVLDGGYVAADKGKTAGTPQQSASKTTLGIHPDGTTYDTVTIVCTSMTTATDCAGMITVLQLK